MIGPLIDGMMPFFREQAESLFTDIIVIYEVTKERAPATSGYIYTTTTVYIGPGKIQFFDNAHEQKAIAGGREFIIDRSFLHLPHAVPHLAIDQYLAVLSSPTSPLLASEDREWRITNVPVKTRATSLRLPILEEMSTHG